MVDDADRRWTLRELAAEVASRLSDSGLDRQESGRVAELPSARAIRYYTTHGLVDRPLDYRGRTALYGRRHLLQLLAIKRLQSRGLSLVEVQQRLLNADERALSELAGAGLGPGLGDVETDDRERGGASPAARAFWKRAPAPIAVGRSAGCGSAVTETTADGVEGVVPAVRLPGEALLLLAGAGRELDEDDVRAIRIAAAPLLKLLAARRLTPDSYSDRDTTRAPAGGGDEPADDDR